MGSFLGALLSRFNTGRSMGGRSKCDRCGHILRAADLVPIFSYVWLQGRCRYCGSRISVQNLLIEVAAATLAVLVYVAHPILGPWGIAPLAFLFWLFVWMTLLFTIVYDIRHTIIPWSCSGLLALLSFVSLFVSFDTLSFMVPNVWALFAGPLLALPLFLLSLISSGRWMGWADSALELSLGWFLGLSLGATALMLAFWSGAIVGVGLLLFAKIPWIQGRSRFTMKSEIPFAPYLALGAFLAYFFHVDLFSNLPLLF